MDVQVCEHTKCHWIIYFKRVNYTVCECYVNKAVKKEKGCVCVLHLILSPCTSLAN